jgi:hypothetical protein
MSPHLSLATGNLVKEERNLASHFVGCVRSKCIPIDVRHQQWTAIKPSQFNPPGNGFCVICAAEYDSRSSPSLFENFHYAALRMKNS